MDQSKSTKGQVIRAIRKAAGVRQKDLAEAAGISPSHLARIEVGMRDTSDRALTEIAAYLGIDKAVIAHQDQDEVAA